MRDLRTMDGMPNTLDDHKERDAIQGALADRIRGALNEALAAYRRLDDAKINKLAMELAEAITERDAAKDRIARALDAINRRPMGRGISYGQIGAGPQQSDAQTLEKVRAALAD